MIYLNKQIICLFIVIIFLLSLRQAISQEELAQIVNEPTIEKKMQAPEVKILTSRDLRLLYYALSGERVTEKVLDLFYPELFSYKDEFERREQHEQRIKMAEERFFNELINNVYEYYYLPLGEVKVREYDFEKSGFHIDLPSNPRFPNCMFFKTPELLVFLSVDETFLPKVIKRGVRGSHLD